MYSLITAEVKEVIKAKEINKKKRHEEFVDVLFNEKVGKEIKVNCTNLAPMIFTRSHCLVLMIRDMCWMMV